MDKKTIKYIEDRIKYLKRFETGYWNKRYEESYPLFERNYYKQCEKDFESRRKELEMLLIDIKP